MKKKVALQRKVQQQKFCEEKQKSWEALALAASSGTFMCSHCVQLYMYLRKQSQGMHAVYQCVCYNCYTEVDGTGMYRALLSDTNSQEIVNTSLF